ncbi:hypothetical protein DSM43518_01400 [Mycobacterium marinum]|nr:hypothetical protein DE4381_02562 [Mycobacterium marinum]RFZ13545.1 hypothetical protein DSM43518_01400 [Mycobacterium marinum]RFZ27646.1 hypothetical protein DSM43519_00612 [Mycobacterium marinum]RFZ30018.1 hypothetical protein DSM44344_00793 [Mycobacterium marinum]
MGARTGLIGEHLPNTNLLTHPEPIGQPKPFMGKGIGRQPHPLPPTPGQHRSPIHTRTPDKRLRHRAHHSERLGPILTQRRHRHHRRLRQRLLDQRRQTTGRPHLHKPGSPRRMRESHTVGKTHRLPNVAHPIISRPVILSHQLTGHIRDHRNSRPPRIHLISHRPELLEHRLHQRRMKSMRHRKPAHPPPLSRQPIRDHTDRLPGTGKHHRPRTIDRGHTDLLTQQRPQLLLASLHRIHRPTIGQRLHQPPPHHHQQRRIR